MSSTCGLTSLKKQFSQDNQKKKDLCPHDFGTVTKSEVLLKHAYIIFGISLKTETHK